MSVAFDGGFYSTLVVCCFGALVSGLFGFGFPLFAMPLLSLLHDTRTAIVISIPITYLIVWWLAFTGSPSVEKPAGHGNASLLRQYWYMPLAVGIGNIVGGLSLREIDTRWLQIGLALMILSYLVFDRLPIQHWRLPSSRALPVGAALGLIGGVFESAVNVAIIPLLLFARLRGLERDATIRYLNTCFVAGRLAQAATFWHAAKVDASAWALGWWVMLPAFAFLLVGIRLRSYLNAEAYQTGVRSLLAVMALGLMLRALFA